ncbi:ATP-grasp fold amidoligase family protein [Fictibacillus enclensis]|uniref:ATP-grasp fold amidoligase family protein n=1 Tax=Fictibacillus enclensis TaxID=1017270 RepID=UPI0024C00CE0|nr:ATP-grasp fold amidoligase family protein [Fictibacillus enclensis]WHY71993.1 ATP-grasp fold amidoligase family protein [Fictibacillus enclensis]
MEVKLKGAFLKSFVSSISPEILTKILYYKNFRKKLNFKKPVSFNEKIQYLKIKKYTDNPTITQCVDKYRIREYLKKYNLDSLCPKLYGVYNNADDIDWDKLPMSFVIKCNHGSGMNILCSEKNELNKEEVKKTLNTWMKKEYWKIFGETQYKNVQKKIIIEELLDPNILTYKFYCFNGQIKVSYVSLNGENGEKEKYIDFFDEKWNWIPVKLWPHEHAPVHPNKPKAYDEMCNIARTLSKDFPFVRVDLYNVNGDIYFSELTFVPTGGMMRLTPESVNEDWGKWLEL